MNFQLSFLLLEPKGLLENQIKVRTRLFLANARLELATDRLHKPIVEVVEEGAMAHEHSLHADGSRDVGRVSVHQAKELGRRNANDCEGEPVYGDPFPNNRGRQIEPALPIRVTDHGYGGSFGYLVVLGGDSAPKGSLHTEGRIVATGNNLASYQLPFAVDAYGEALGHGGSKNAREHAVLIAKTFERAVAKAIKAALVVRILKKDQSLGVLNGQHSQQDSIDNAKHGCIGPDPERKRQNCDRREAGVLRQHPHAVV